MLFLCYYVEIMDKKIPRNFLLLVCLAVFFTPAHSSAFAPKTEECVKCHSLKKDEAAALLRALDPKVRVSDVRVNPVKGLWELTVDTGGKKSILYIDFSKKYLFNGILIDLQKKKNLTEERLTELNRVKASEIPLKDALVLGNRNAKHKVVVFDDPD